jgi:uncharacterized protein YlxP (DUF503 family)
MALLQGPAASSRVAGAGAAPPEARAERARAEEEGVLLFTGTLTADLLLGDVHSLKGKRAVVRPIVAELRRRFAVAAAEVGDQELHRRVQVGVATVAGDAGQVTDVLDSCERLLAERPEVTLLSTHRQLFADTDDC